MEEAKNKLSKEAYDNLQNWLSDIRFADFRAEIFELINSKNWAELEDAFFKELSFGTAGVRGKFGAGCNRINSFMVSKIAQAMADFFVKNSVKNPKVVIAYDVRNSSFSLAEEVAEVLAGNGVKVFFFESPRSTPELSFAVRKLQTDFGVVISASHNPPKDNGIKIYGKDGAQLSHPKDIEMVKMVQNVSKINHADFENAIKSRQIELISSEIDNAYIGTLLRNSLFSGRDLRIVFSPLCGTGVTNVLSVLRRAGFERTEIVRSQFLSDGDFLTVRNQKPNPEIFAANLEAISKMQKIHADIALTSDPDADRLCVISREKTGTKVFSGNEVAILLADFVLSKIAKNRQKSPKFIAKTCVTTDALNALAKKYGVKIYDNFLVGFKYIGKTIFEKELLGEEFIAGFEESLGGLIGVQTRDKDAASVALLVAECAAELKTHGKTLGEKLSEIYDEIGYFAEKTVSLEFSGADGFRKMQQIMSKIRAGGIDFGEDFSNDFLNLQRVNIKTGEVSKIDFLENGDAMSFEFGDKRKRITIRPSGTEPKIKIYAQWIFEKSIEVGEISEILNKFKERILNEC